MTEEDVMVNKTYALLSNIRLARSKQDNQKFQELLKDSVRIPIEIRAKVFKQISEDLQVLLTYLDIYDAQLGCATDNKGDLGGTR
jgi:hypothetical protein